MSMNKQSGWKNVLMADVIIIGTMLLTIGFLAVLIQKGTVGIASLRVGLMICCLISGTVGILFSAKGKGRLQRILTGLFPTVTLLVIGTFFAEEGSSSLGFLLNSAALLLPSILSLAEGKGRKRNNVKIRKKHRIKGYTR